MWNDDGETRRRPRLWTLLLALIFLIVVGVPAGVIGNLYAHLDALSENIRNAQPEAVNEELETVRVYYDNSRAWGAQWLGDYVLADAFLQRAAYAYLVEDYERVVSTLQDRVDDPRASFLLGCAKFHLAARRYGAIAGQGPAAAARRVAVIQDIIDGVNPDFERAVRADASQAFQYKWNYDLTSDADALKRALEAPAAPADDEPPEATGIGTPMRRRRG